jgi:hypothetical protein
MRKRIALRARSFAALAVAVGALAQGVPVGSEPPKLRGQTLDGNAIILPDAAAGKVMLLVVGASKKAGERTAMWKDHFVADFGSTPNATYYVAALLQAAPAPFRGIIRSGMRSGTPPAAQAHILTSTSDNDTWKEYLNIRDDSLPAVLLLDASGHARWSYNGLFDPSRYQSLKEVTEAILQRR